MLLESSTFLSLCTPFTVQVGVGCLVAQCILYVVFATNGFGLFPQQGPWRDTPGFTAHQVVTIPVLTYLTLEGMREWVLMTSVEEEPTAAERILGPALHGHLSEFVLGMMAFWGKLL
jgi:hypothetical protein